MRRGMHPMDAAEDAIKRITRHYPSYVGAVVAADIHGRHGAACNGWVFKYAMRTCDMDAAKVTEVQPLQSSIKSPDQSLL